jgi:hypothetical protein
MILLQGFHDLVQQIVLRAEPSGPDWGEITLAAATVALAAITGYYAVQTNRLVKIPFKTHIMAEYAPHHKTDGQETAYITLYIRNLWTGPATRVKVEYRVNTSGETGSKEFSFIRPQSKKVWPVQVSQPERNSKRIFI